MQSIPHMCCGSMTRLKMGFLTEQMQFLVARIIAHGEEARPCNAAFVLQRIIFNERLKEDQEEVRCIAINIFLTLKGSGIFSLSIEQGCFSLLVPCI